ncbi:PREDICTED: TBC1 domain family member 5-like [Galeopterus variegatus]|uniref:Protein phosphatase 1 regulatory subunit 14 n=1 Tax=Galeopterus variegatus TaxID=482537 RepID=A0ABM0S3C2_GALVR|nr:PREDICTED: TBC1 domain family member 5-like [Galeopterus variegatus]
MRAPTYPGHLASSKASVPFTLLRHSTIPLLTFSSSPGSSSGSGSSREDSAPVATAAAARQVQQQQQQQQQQQRRHQQGKVTVKYDRKELRKRLVLEEWIVEQLSQLYGCEEFSGALPPGDRAPGSRSFSLACPQRRGAATLALLRSPRLRLSSGRGKGSRRSIRCWDPGSADSRGERAGKGLEAA